MNCLLYGILRKKEVLATKDFPVGVCGNDVRLISEGNLCAVYSHISRMDSSPDLEKAMAYGRVVAFFHRRSAVIPLRYGCLMESTERIGTFLHTQTEACDALLSELEGCVEMGIRLLPPKNHAFVTGSGRLLPVTKESCSEESREKIGATGQEALKEDGIAAGSDYLKLRRRHYAAADEEKKINQEVEARCRRAFAGLYRRCKSEFPSTLSPSIQFQPPLLSLYFLVPENATAPFGEAFGKLRRDTEASMLLSGPWPPYNFAVISSPPGLV
jgi:hypothetical protein